MLSGYFADERGRRVPRIRCDFQFPNAPHVGTQRIELLIDTGADRTTLSGRVAESIGLNLSALPFGGISSGIGGQTAVRVVESMISVQGYTIPFPLRILESRHPAPSILGRDFMANFALFMEERTGRVLFLDQTDIARYGLTALGSP